MSSAVDAAAAASGDICSTAMLFALEYVCVYFAFQTIAQHFCMPFARVKHYSWRSCL